MLKWVGFVVALLVMILTMQVAPSGVTRPPFGVTNCRGSDRLPGDPKMGHFFGLSALPVSISTYLVLTYNLTFSSYLARQTLKHKSYLLFLL